MKKIKFLSLAMIIFLSIFTIMSISIKAESRFSNMSTQEFVDYINDNPKVLAYVYSIINASYPQLDNEPLTEEQLDQYIQDTENYYFTIPGSWHFEYYSSELTTSSSYTASIPFENVKAFSPKGMQDWSWLEFFLDGSKKLAIHLDSFTESDFYWLNSSNFNEVCHHKLYSIATTGFNRIISLNLGESLSLDLLDPQYEDDYNSKLFFYSIGGRYPVNLNKDNYTRIDSIGPSQLPHTYTGPNGLPYELEYVSFYSHLNVVLFDNGTYLYYDDYYFSSPDFSVSEDPYTRSFYSPSLLEDPLYLETITINGEVKYPQPVAIYAMDQMSYEYTKIDEEVVIKYYNENKELVESAIPVDYDNQLSNKTFKWGGSRNIYSPLMINTHAGYDENIRWAISSSYWQPLFIFEGVDGEAVTVNYLDENDVPLRNPIILEGLIGDSFSSQQLDFQGYTFSTVEEVTSGIFTSQPQFITYRYTKDQAPIVPDEKGRLSIHYLTVEGQELHQSDVIEDLVGNTFTAAARNFEGYQLDHTEGPTSGLFTAQPQELIYYYRSIEVPSENKGTVIVNYLTLDEIKLSEPDILRGIIGTDFVTAQREFENYIFHHSEGHTSGTFNDETQIVTYYYSQMTSNQIGYVSVSYVDDKGNKLADDVILSGIVNDTYMSEEKTFEGYDLYEIQGDQNGVFQDTMQRVHYIYQKNTSPTLPNTGTGSKIQETVEIILVGAMLVSFGLYIRKFSKVKEKNN